MENSRASIAGLDVVRQQSQVRQQIGLVFQDPSLDERLSGLQNLRFHALVYGVPASVREPRIEQLLHMVELWDKRHNKVQTFSGGMKRRLEMARGLLHHPRVLFLDEPTLGLDPQTRNRMWEYILELQRQMFVVAAELATDPAHRDRLEPAVSRCTPEMVAALEDAIDRIVADRGTPTEFVVPGGMFPSGSPSAGS